MRTLIILFIWIPLVLVVAAWVETDFIWQWRAALLTLELGHFAALLTLITTCYIGARMTKGFLRTTHLILGFLTCGALLVPAVTATWVTGGQLSWTRMYALKYPAFPPVETSRSVYREVDGREMEIVLHKQTDATGPQPVVLFVHGGSWQGGSPTLFENWNIELASHGYAVVALSYRFAPEHKWPAQRDDVVAAVQWVRDNAVELGLDPNRISLLGRSAGGQIAMATALTRPDLNLRSCISYYAPMDLIFARSKAREDDVLNTVKLLRELLGGDPDVAEANYRDASPIFHLDAQTPPVLLIHGANDALVWVLQSRRFHTRMEESNQPGTFHDLFWATHGSDYFPFSPGGQTFMLKTLEFLEEVNQ